MDHTPRPLLEEFSKCVADVTLFYQVLRMEETLYVWVGTEAGRMNDLTAVFKPRIQNAPPAVSNLLGPSGNIFSNSLSERLHSRTGKNVFLSVDCPDENLFLRIEEELVSHLSNI